MDYINPILKKVYIEPTVRCNLKCPLCYAGRNELNNSEFQTLDRQNNSEGDEPKSLIEELKQLFDRRGS